MPEGTLYVQRTDEVVPPQRHDLLDNQLLEEIELLVDVITRVAGHDGYLSRDEVDSVLGLPRRFPRRLPRPGGHNGFKSPIRRRPCEPSQA